MRIIIVAHIEDYTALLRNWCTTIYCANTAIYGNSIVDLAVPILRKFEKIGGKCASAVGRSIRKKLLLPIDKVYCYTFYAYHVYLLCA